MVAILVLLLMFLILISVFIGKNIVNTCPIWFFRDFGETNIVVIIFFAFAAGVIFSLFLLLVEKIYKASKKDSDDTTESIESKRKKFHKRYMKQGDGSPKGSLAKVSSSVENPSDSEEKSK